MKYMGMVKRRASTKAKTMLINFDVYIELKEIFLQDIKHSMLMDEIPQELVINFWDSLCSCIRMDYGKGGSKES